MDAIQGEEGQKPKDEGCLGKHVHLDTGGRSWPGEKTTESDFVDDESPFYEAVVATSTEAIHDCSEGVFGVR